ncbi:PHB depolymerase family esterase [Domibacillus sp. DTU_2020_1001157_1_SI_ALB_TIR_016]|uniref:alpha/beta hydrolase family esterase n=1 Tax=Domibacillus sp. DTU_2020_1001157_1_SI_ALB_TIR_016 TaxID=3077789 RepID=UPI0028E62F68|nr:PHB depolymerase family esterase [Domibacillus sp. DTU_2020_1001157_1_SI_ALB_TIR_016]WNS77941.1 PHB depolymerase family esterase [Domibacillus sp. DTU_2020_1001157_1_SI_ALB_TIR_016]
MKKQTYIVSIAVSLMTLSNIIPVSAGVNDINYSKGIDTLQKADDNQQIKTKASLEAISLDNMEKPSIDITLGNKLPLTGYFTRNVTVGNETRTVKVYIAPDTTVRDYFTVLTVPEGMTTEEFLKNSGWLDIANEKSEGLFILEPGDNGWGTVEEERAYMEQAFKLLRDTKYYNTFGLFYLAGYGEGGTALQAWAMENPLSVISSVFVETRDLDANFIAGTGAKTFSENNGISYSEVPVPTWFVNNDLNSVKNLVEYWKAANDVTAVSTKSPSGLVGSTVFMQDKDSESIVTSYSDVLSKVAVLEKGDRGIYMKGFTKKMYDFLSYYTRYDNTTVNGNVLGVRPDYEAMGVEVKKMVLDGYTREYLVYTPDSAPKKDIPVVFALAGNTQTARVFFDASHWWEAADKYGFMLVVPSEQYSSSTEVTWNVNYDPAKQDDFVFLEEVVKQIDEDYNIDPGRRYLTGQSLGSMFSNYATTVLPEYFAAIGTTSGPLLRPAEGKIDKMPAYLLFGEHDLWSWDHTEDGPTKNTVEYWLSRNGLGTIDDAVVTQKDRYTTYTWYDENDIPMYKYTQTEGRAHNFIVSEVWELWEEWFSHWKMDTEGTRHYTN